VLSCSKDARRAGRVDHDCWHRCRSWKPRIGTVRPDRIALIDMSRSRAIISRPKTIPRTHQAESASIASKVVPT
jgi:hypothetical protein